MYTFALVIVRKNGALVHCIKAPFSGQQREQMYTLFPDNGSTYYTIIIKKRGQISCFLAHSVSQCH
jgi:hypothetical protein